jgi:hypothetical protein
MASTRPKLIRLGWHVLLALVLLLMQQAGLRHSLEHIAHDEDSAPTHAACLLCVAHHVQDQAPGSTPPGLLEPIGMGHVLSAVTGQAQCTHGVRLHYRSRAPPSDVSA